MSGIVRYGQQVPSRVESAESGTLPPHDLVAETAVISAILIDETPGNKAMKVALSLLTHEHFYSEAHRRIFEAMSQVSADGVGVDIYTTINQLTAKRRLEQVGGKAYIERVFREGYGGNIRAYAECVYDMWRRREMIALCRKTEAELCIGETGADELQGFLDRQARAAISIASRGPRSTGESVTSVINRVMRAGAMAAKNAAEGKRPKGATTSLKALDWHFGGGMFPGNKYSVVALPGCGKSVVGVQCATANASVGVGSVVFATEQTLEQLGVRVISAASSINNKRVQQFMHRPMALSNEEWQRMTSVAANWKKLPLHFESDHSLSVDDIVTKVITLKNAFPGLYGTELVVVVVDYLQRLARPKHMRPDTHKTAILEYNTRTIKTLAAEEGLIIMELAQQKFVKDRNGDPRKPEEGMVDFSRDCERESDGVVYIHARNKEKTDFGGIVTKVREGGEPGEFDIDFDKPHSRMTADFNSDLHGPR